MTSFKSIATAFIMLLNLAMFSTNAASCPSLGACLSIANDLVNVQVGSQASTRCCQLIGGLVGAEANLCLCNTLKTSSLGTQLGSVLNLIDDLPIIGGLFGSLPILGTLPLGLLNLPFNLLDNILNQEVLVLVNACGVDATMFNCTT